MGRPSLMSGARLPHDSFLVLLKAHDIWEGNLPLQPQPPTATSQRYLSKNPLPGRMSHNYNWRSGATPPARSWATFCKSNLVCFKSGCWKITTGGLEHHETSGSRHERKHENICVCTPSKDQTPSPHMTQLEATMPTTLMIFDVKRDDSANWYDIPFQNFGA